VEIPIVLLAIISVSFVLHLPPPTLQVSNDGDTDSLIAKPKPQRIDYTGALFLTLTIFSLLLFFDQGGNVSWTAPFTILPLVTFILSAIAFAIVESKYAQEPLAPLHLFLLYLQAVHRITPAEVGRCLALSVLGNLSGSLLSGMSIQKVGKFKLARVG
jgi:hypothetical protein